MSTSIKSALSRPISFPRLSTELLDELEAHFPLTNPPSTASLRDIDRRAGFQECIETLKAARERLNKEGRHVLTP